MGTGTIVAAATAGLAFAQPEGSHERRPASNKRKLTADFGSMRLPSPFRPPNSAGFDCPAEDLAYTHLARGDEPLPNPLSSHPSSFARPRTTHSQLTPPKNESRRQSFMRQNDLSARPIAENARDSISSNGSWMRRLSSMRPLSQHGSPRSSLGPDAPSLFSHGSGTPMLPPNGSAVSQLPPNKLVKRGTSVQSNSPATISRQASRSQMPSLRRPATSHQRSATLQQFQAQGGVSGPPQAARLSLDQQLRPKKALPAEEVGAAYTHQENIGWTSFFHLRAIKRIGRGSLDNSNVVPGPNKRVQLPFGGNPRAYLIKASALVTGTAVQPEEAGYQPDDYGMTDDRPETKDGSPISADETPTKRARRSISMHFSSPTTWISKTGSIRRAKRGLSEAKLAGKRNVSDPTTSTSPPSAGQPEPKAAVALDQIFLSRQPRQQLEPESASSYHHPKARKRNSSSPLPPLSRLSSFNVDISRVGLTTASSSSGSRRPSHAPAPLSTGPHVHLSTPQSRAVSGERASTVVSSDFENLFTSGDDDDTDGRSDTVYDSFRTGTSARLRTVETPLESMFDESPPSTAGNSRTKRLSIQEILGQSWDVDTNIIEEDETISTPIRVSHAQDDVEMADRPLQESSAFDRNLSMAHMDFARMSLDDDDDDDWARDDDTALSNHLSPPTSSLSSRRGAPNLRHALASISGNSNGDRFPDTLSERPRSTIFDWSEPVAPVEVEGYSPRPKTVHGKQELDLRGGRPANRKGPVAAHVRSQSVPVVPDPSETSKVVPKFGTWGMGTKNVSEDWEDDFDLDEDPVRPVGGKDSATSFSMVVPPSIQATQNTVKVHSGQIRELSLLVNDLKRLCRHGKDLDIIDGSSAAKWREAENIIELAAPDDEEEEDGPQSPAGQIDESDAASSIDERFLDEGFDAASLEHKPSYSSFRIEEPGMSKTAVVRERQLVRRRSVFSPEDDIFGNNWPLPEENGSPYPPRTPDQLRNSNRDSAMISIVMEAMQQQRAAEPVRRRSPVKPSQSKLFFDTNSLQELVKRASHLRDSLSDMVRRAEVLTQSPAGTPRRDQRHSRLADGSPAFTRVFTEPPSSPSQRLPKSHSSSTVLSGTSVDSPRMQVMTVS